MTKRNRRRIFLLGLAVLGAALAAVFVIGFRATTHPSERASVGEPSSGDALEASLAKPGPIVVETIAAADWEVDRAGLINLDHADAKKEGLSNGPEPIQIYLHVLRHPQKGTFLVDTGVERALKTEPEKAAIRGLVAHFINADKMTVHTDTATFLAREATPPAGVLMTHLHLDHVSGMPDLPKGTPIFTGPGEAGARAALFAFVQGSTDRALEGHAPLSELSFAPDPSGRFAGVLDLFGDQSIWAIWVPGHTPGSLAFLARTPDGPVLFAGDTCHTAWGWEHGVEPGSFTADQPLNATSLRSLKALVARHPQIDVRLGHQPLASPNGASARSAVLTERP